MADERSIREVRLEKLERLRALGCDPFKQERFERDHSAQELLDRFDEFAGHPQLQTPNSKPQTRYAGRVVSYRLMGKAGFAHVSDGDAKIQVYFRKDDLTQIEWELYTLLDIGDHIGVTGELFRTKTGEKSIHARSLLVLSKCLEALPVGKVREIKDETGKVVGTQTWYELEDTEQRYRHRHLDLIANPEARAMLIQRAKIATAVRRYFDSQGFLEVETPMLQVRAGGAHARPFITHYNHYDMDVKLRISLELYLKRIICGDIPKVYEIGRVFRNEGVSSRHSPEFTLCEFYEAYANLEDMMTRMEECFRFVGREVFGTEAVRIGGLEDWRTDPDQAVLPASNPSVLDF
ncbi:MAG TPA: amino acid--tRNA ligase-related protein, partial [Fimbriimonadaceae bacterium]|nr:amino acid--tRNA ligase-related protein [Fimbriimonadaceae bacterium]